MHGQILPQAAERQQRKLAHDDNVTAALSLHESRTRAHQEVKTLKTAFFWAAAEPPRRYSSRLQKLSFQGPHARREAEDAERSRWIEHLAQLLKGSPTPMVGCCWTKLAVLHYSERDVGQRHCGAESE